MTQYVSVRLEYEGGVEDWGSVPRISDKPCACSTRLQIEDRLAIKGNIIMKSSLALLDSAHFFLLGSAEEKDSLCFQGFVPFLHLAYVSHLTRGDGGSGRGAVQH